MGTLPWRPQLLVRCVPPAGQLHMCGLAGGIVLSQLILFFQPGTGCQNSSQESAGPRDKARWLRTAANIPPCGCLAGERAGYPVCWRLGPHYMMMLATFRCACELNSLCCQNWRRDAMALTALPLGRLILTPTLVGIASSRSWLGEHVTREGSHCQDF